MTTYNGMGASEQGADHESIGPSKEGACGTLPRICFECSGVVGVIKPAGLPTQAPARIDSVERWLRSQLPRGGYLGVPHRLDRAVSGIMVFAVTPRAARQLSRQFERRQVTKAYVALTEAGDPRPDEDIVSPVITTWCEWVDWIAKVPDQPRARIVATDARDARQAETRVRRIGAVAGPAGSSIAMLQLEPRTGRMHQLRVQAAARGTPIVGDTVYGACGDMAADPERGCWFGGTDAWSMRIALHARRIAFTDPDTKKPVMIEAPLPEYWPPACHEMLERAEVEPAHGTGSKPE